MTKRRLNKGPGSRPGTPHQKANKDWEQWLTIDGKRHRVTRATKREVEQRVAEIRAGMHDPAIKLRKALGPTIAELFASTLARYEKVLSTQQTYGYALARWSAVLGAETHVSTITPAMVQTAVDTLAQTLEPTTIATYFAALRVAVGATHPAVHGITLPSADDDDGLAAMVLPPDLAERLQAAAQHHPRGILIGLGFGAGLRAGEAVALRLRDVDYTRGLLSINGSIKRGEVGSVRGRTKNRKTRLVRVSPDLLAWLERHQQMQAATAELGGFPAPAYVASQLETGGFLGRDIPTLLLRQLLRAVCTPEELALYSEARYHDLRHTHLSGLLARGVGFPDVAARAGHSIQQLINTYAHMMPGEDRRIAALAGELFPVPRPLATSEAIRAARGASRQGTRLTVTKAGDIRSNPQIPAGSAPTAHEEGPTSAETRSEPLPLATPEATPQKGGVA